MKFLVLLALISFAAAQVQVQIRPQPPQQQQPQWPTFPQPPRAQPRASWRDSVNDPRCVGVDDHEGYPFFLPGNGQWDFFICWGDRAWPFSCPTGTVWWAAERTCALPSQIPQRIRPFSDDEEAQE
ncbi:uncharacterized protein [Chironomus tepperi]|uniref:uncharacterized protein n=1 Tax=Chironomus tepperi TaxID=113505 RepID=UPI00391FC375